MTVIIPKKELTSALDDGRVTFIDDMESLTPQDVDQILRKNADRLAEPSGKHDIDVKGLFPQKPPVKVSAHKCCGKCCNGVCRCKMKS